MVSFSRYRCTIIFLEVAVGRTEEGTINLLRTRQRGQVLEVLWRSSGALGGKGLGALLLLPEERQERIHDRQKTWSQFVNSPYVDGTSKQMAQHSSVSDLSPAAEAGHFPFSSTALVVFTSFTPGTAAASCAYQHVDPREQYPFRKNLHGTELGGRFTLSPTSGVVAPLKVDADAAADDDDNDDDGVKGAAAGEYSPGSLGMVEEGGLEGGGGNGRSIVDWEKHTHRQDKGGFTRQRKHKGHRKLSNRIKYRYYV